MVYECIVIVLLLLFVVLAFLRAKRRMWAGATLPMLVIPVVNIISYYIVKYVISMEFEFYIAVLILVISLAVSCTWVGFFCAMALPQRKIKTTYMIVSILFDLTLTAILMYDYYNVLVLGN